MKPNPKAKAHNHEYAPHPKWDTSVYCVKCGFAIPKSALDYALRNGATLAQPKE